MRNYQISFSYVETKDGNFYIDKYDFVIIDVYLPLQSICRARHYWVANQDTQLLYRLHPPFLGQVPIIFVDRSLS